MENLPVTRENEKYRKYTDGEKADRTADTEHMKTQAKPTVRRPNSCPRALARLMEEFRTTRNKL